MEKEIEVEIWPELYEELQQRYMETEKERPEDTGTFEEFIAECIALPADKNRIIQQCQKQKEL